LIWREIVAKSCKFIRSTTLKVFSFSLWFFLFLFVLPVLRDSVQGVVPLIKLLGVLSRVLRVESFRHMGLTKRYELRSVSMPLTFSHAHIVSWPLWKYHIFFLHLPWLPFIPFLLWHFDIYVYMFLYFVFIVQVCVYFPRKRRYLYKNNWNTFCLFNGCFFDIVLSYLNVIHVYLIK